MSGPIGRVSLIVIAVAIVGVLIYVKPKKSEVPGAPSGAGAPAGAGGPANAAASAEAAKPAILSAA